MATPSARKPHGYCFSAWGMYINTAITKSTKTARILSRFVDSLALDTASWRQASFGRRQASPAYLALTGKRTKAAIGRKDKEFKHSQKRSASQDRLVLRFWCPSQNFWRWSCLRDVGHLRIFYTPRPTDFVFLQPTVFVGINGIHDMDCLLRHGGTSRDGNLSR